VELPATQCGLFFIAKNSIKQVDFSHCLPCTVCLVICILIVFTIIVLFAIFSMI